MTRWATKSRNAIGSNAVAASVATLETVINNISAQTLSTIPLSTIQPGALGAGCGLIFVHRCSNRS